MVFCPSPKHCKYFSLAGNPQAPLPLGNSLLSFLLHRCSSSHSFPLTVSTRSLFSGPNVSCVPLKLCCQGSEGAPHQPSAEHCAAAAAFLINPQALISGSPWWAVSICSSAQYSSYVLDHKRPSEKLAKAHLLFV